MKSLPATFKGMKAEIKKRSNWNGKSTRKNFFWLLDEMHKAHKESK